MKKNNIESKKNTLIKKLFSFIQKNQLTNNNPTSLNIFKKQLYDIFKLEVTSMGFKYEEQSKNNDIDLGFALDFSTTWQGKCLISREYDYLSDQYVITKAKILINEASDCFHKLFSNNAKNRLEGCKKILEILYHELKHYRQHEMMSIKYPSKALLDMEKEYLVFDEMNSDNFYRDNHNLFLTEADAILDSYNKTKEYEEFFPRKDVDSVYIRNNLEFAKIKVLNKNGNYDVYYRNNYINSFVDNSLHNNFDKEYFKKYPSLTYEYNTDCTRKNIFELYSDYKNQLKVILSENSLDEEEKNRVISDINELYYELFYSQLTITSDNMFDVFLEKYDSDEINDFLEEIKRYFRLERIRKSELSNTCYLTKSKYRNKDTRHIASNQGYVEINNATTKSLVSIDKYASKLNTINETERKRLSRIIPRCGYYILNNGGKIPAIDFLNNMIKDISYEKDENDVREVIDYDKMISSFVKPEEEVEHILNLEKLNRDYQLQILSLNSYQERIQKRKTKKIIKKMWEKHSTNGMNKYNLSNINVRQIDTPEESVVRR